MTRGKCRGNPYNMAARARDCDFDMRESATNQRLLLQKTAVTPMRLESSKVCLSVVRSIVEDPSERHQPVQLRGLCTEAEGSGYKKEKMRRSHSSSDSMLAEALLE